MVALLLAACIGSQPMPDTGEAAPTEDSAQETAAIPTDADADGFPDDFDCDDANPEVHPEAVELCNGTDDNCDGVVDEDSAADATEWFEDGDGDGWGSGSVWACSPPPATASMGGDCDDGSPAAHPDAAETCDGTDEDCDGVVDDACATAPVGELHFEDAQLFLWGQASGSDSFLHPSEVDLDGDGIFEAAAAVGDENGGWFSVWEAPYAPDEELDGAATSLVAFPNPDEVH